MINSPLGLVLVKDMCCFVANSESVEFTFFFSFSGSKNMLVLVFYHFQMSTGSGVGKGGGSGRQCVTKMKLFVQKLFWLKVCTPQPHLRMFNASCAYFPIKMNIKRQNEEIQK